MVEQRSAASMNFDNHGSQGASLDQESRRGIAREAQRATAGPAVVAWYAERNPAINPEKSHLNVDRVNDGAGGFRPTKSIEEVVAYGDERVARLKPGLKTDNRFMVTTVFHCPWAYLEEDGTHYQPIDENGNPKLLPSGEPLLEPRYRIKPGCEARVQQYFDDCLTDAASILPGGQPSMHGYSINMDESRPHLQLESDPFEDDPRSKSNGLKNGYSRAFGRHPKDALVAQRDKEGESVLDGNGDPVMVRPNASRKMEDYQAAFRARMVERGYEVDPERDEERHARHLGLQDYKDLQHSRRQVQHAMADVGTAIGETEAMRDAAASQLSEAHINAHAIQEQTIAAHEFARESGYADGLTAAEAAVVARTAALDQRAAGIDAEVKARFEAHRDNMNEWWRTTGHPEAKRMAVDAVRAEMADEIAGAKAAAAQINVAAQTEAGTIKEQAHAQGLAEGRAEGRVAGRKERLAEMEPEVEAAKTDRADAAASLARQRRAEADLAERLEREEAEKRAEADRRVADYEAEQRAKVPAYDPKAAEAHAPAELIRNVKRLNADGSLRSGPDDPKERLTTKLHAMGVANHKKDRTGVSEKQFMTETTTQRGERIRETTAKLAGQAEAQSEQKQAGHGRGR